MSNIEYTVKDLNKVVEYFQLLASDQIGCKRFQQTKRAKIECEIRASVWNDAADILKKVKITVDC